MKTKPMPPFTKIPKSSGKKPNSHLTSILVLGLFVTGSLAFTGHTQNSKGNKHPKVSQEMFNKLERILELRQQQTQVAESNFKSGRTSSEAFTKTAIREQKAKFKWAKYSGNMEKQAEALASIIQYRKQYLNRLRIRHEAGKATAEEMINAEVAFLKSEWTLLKFKQKQN